MTDFCVYCGHRKAQRNPSGRCDHLFWPYNLTDEAKEANGIMTAKTATETAFQKAARANEEHYKTQKFTNMMEAFAERWVPEKHDGENTREHARRQTMFHADLHGVIRQVHAEASEPFMKALTSAAMMAAPTAMILSRPEAQATGMEPKYSTILDGLKTWLRAEHAEMKRLSKQAGLDTVRRHMGGKAEAHEQTIAKINELDAGN